AVAGWGTLTASEPGSSSFVGRAQLPARAARPRAASARRLVCATAARFWYPERIVRALELSLVRLGKASSALVLAVAALGCDGGGAGAGDGLGGGGGADGAGLGGAGGQSVADGRYVLDDAEEGCDDVEGLRAEAVLGAVGLTFSGEVSWTDLETGYEASRGTIEVEATIEDGGTITCIPYRHYPGQAPQPARLAYDAATLAMTTADGALREE